MAQGKPAPATGAEACKECHEENFNQFAATRHANKKVAGMPGEYGACSACHGDASEHVKSKGGKTGAMIPLASKTVPAEERNAVCMNCHNTSKRIHWNMSAHDARGVACVNCHQVHTTHDRVMDKAAQSDVCFTCHKDVRVQTFKPSRHPIQEGKVSCADCHSTHGSSGPKMMKRDTVNDTCFQCHMEKRGPFLWNHQPVTEDCAICHNPHGSTNDSMLRQRSPFLCQSCHEGTSHRGNAPSTRFGNMSDELGVGVTLARGCTACHTAIHGGNNPTNNSGSRSFRR